MLCNPKYEATLNTINGVKSTSYDNATILIEQQGNGSDHTGEIRFIIKNQNV